MNDAHENLCADFQKYLVATSTVVLQIIDKNSMMANVILNFNVQ